jgi:hypothetical protein
MWRKMTQIHTNAKSTAGNLHSSQESTTVQISTKFQAGNNSSAHSRLVFIVITVAAFPAAVIMGAIEIIIALRIKIQCLRKCMELG